ncbi:MAG: family intrarane metalloprotease [Flaviaesturariibacter sp.]|nr:family intrarane metalloprotease [Flaviaesturariibacter sp.]
MKKIITFLKEYLATIDRVVLFGTALMAAVAITCNYDLGWNRWIGRQALPMRLLCWFATFLCAFAAPYVLAASRGARPYFRHSRFRQLLLLAPALFAAKMAVPLHLSISPDAAVSAYWTAVAYFPLKLAVMLACLYLAWRHYDRDRPFYGTSTAQLALRPYLLMLLVMLPLIALAATQHDFLQTYPKMSRLAYLRRPGTGWEKLLYELSYGTDFVSIEFFFRGFLVLAFARWAGRDAILPMALFYCTIHFGKPLGECISSFFGGILLGVVTFRTSTVWGGLMVHLGIAWLMEACGFLGHYFLQ